MSYQSIGASVLGITSHKLFLIFALKEVEPTRPVADDFQIGVVHGELTEAENATAMVDVSRGGKRRLEHRQMPTGIED